MLRILDPRDWRDELAGMCCILSGSLEEEEVFSSVLGRFKNIREEKQIITINYQSNLLADIGECTLL